jgi:CRISPR-associated protein Csm1
MNNHKATLYLQTLLSSLNDYPDFAGIKHPFNDWKRDESFAQILEKAGKYAAGGLEFTKGQSFVKPVANNLIFEKKATSSYNASDYFFSQRPVSIAEDYFPTQTPTSYYAGFWEEFSKDMNRLPKGDNWVIAETLLSILHKFGATIPSGYQADVSLYDFAKAKAGMAVCLYDFQNDLLAENEHRDQSCPFLLVGGGLSGIQKYLFDIASRNAAKNMKGRSYFLHLLSDSVVRLVLDQLGLHQANVVIATGGGFQIIAPNTVAVKDRLTTLRMEIRERLFKDYKTQLFLEFAWTELNEEHLLKGRVSEAWSDLNDQFGEQKRQKFQEHILTNYAEFFEPIEAGGEEIRDAITVEELPTGVRKWKLEGAYPAKLKKDQEEEAAANRGKIVGKITAEQIWLGLRLRESNVHVSALSKVEMAPIYRSLKKDEYYRFAQLKVMQLLVLKDEFKEVLFHGKKVSIHYVNDTASFLQYARERKESFGFDFYGGNEIPKITAKPREKQGKTEELPKTFSELALQADDDREYPAEVEKQFQGEHFKRLAILRMDVDGLGSVFQDGFNIGGTLTRYSALSRQMDWFFKGHLNEIWKKGTTPDGQPFNEFTQILYSGGDDLFIVGKWDCVIAIADNIRTAFKAYTCESPYFNISGGMVMATPKFPVARAAKWCEEEEKKAKHHTLKSSKIEKDSFSLFGVPLKWDTEYKLVKSLKAELIGFLEKHANHKGILIALQEFDELRKDQILKGNAESWRWQLAYQLNRAIKRNNLESEDFIRQLQLGIFFDNCTFTKEADLKRGESQYPILQLISLAARWAEFELRSGGKPATGSSDHHD